MQNTTHRINFEDQQARIALLAKTAVEGYHALWEQMVAQWRAAETDAAWLTYCANYLFHTAGVHWALDPLSLFSRLSLPNNLDFANDLAPLEAVVLTHRHADHLDLELLSDLVDLPISWIVPEFMLKEVQTIFMGKTPKVVIPQPGVPIQIKNLVLTPFEGLHFRDGNGVPEMGYLAEFSGKRWAFPGDTRLFPPESLTKLGSLDGIFAHLWLGKKCALYETPPLLEDFCRFITEPAPRRLVVTHMHELARKPDDFWDTSHFSQVNARCGELNPEILITPAWTGMSVEL
ncbi:MAG TPA: MBL fold metallo-hydrolase [Anaerolineaceae bacterium]|nr:MBL fold metallo-hydrolase [Anaerolineaceae bacterium]